jgi:hypothetical protein
MVISKLKRTAGGAMLALAAAFALASGAASALSNPVGTTLTGTLDHDLSSGHTSVGEQFRLNVTQPYPNGDSTFAGAVVYGHVDSYTKAGSGTPAKLELSFDKIYFPVTDRTRYISGHMTQADVKKDNSAVRTGIAVVVGNILGNYVGKHIGGVASTIGGVAGGAGGYLYAANLKDNITIKSGSPLSFQVDSYSASRPQASEYATPAPYATPTLTP